MIQSWKIPPIIKGLLTWIPPLNAWCVRHMSTGGTDSPRYCYAVWLRHLVMLEQHGFRIKHAQIGELGPGDSLGVGLAALLCGADRYVGLDVMPFSARADLEKIFDELVQLYRRKEPIPDHHEFPAMRPRLASYEFPHSAIDQTDFPDRIERIRQELRAGVNKGHMLRYLAPWTSINDIAADSLDLIFSHSVLQYVKALEETYGAIFTWLKPGGYASHSIGFHAHYLSPFWNGHWAYTDWEWQLVRGRREFFLTRKPLGTHIRCAKGGGFEVLLLRREESSGGLSVNALSKQFQTLDAEDLHTCGAMLILRRPC